MNKVDKFINSLSSLEGKKVVVTGANSGLGLAIVKTCLSKGASVVLACRNETRANKTKEDLLKEFPNATIDILLYSQDIFSSCLQFVDNLFGKHSDFYALVLNAGLFNAKKGELNSEGLPIVSGTNAFGLAYILNHLDERLKEVESEKRIIIHGSLASRLSKYKGIDKSLLNAKAHHFTQYNISKTAAHNLFYYYAQHNINPNVKYLLSEPGVARSNIIRNYPKWFRYIADLFMRVFCSSSKEGAAPTNYLISEIAANGDYYIPRGLFAIRGLPKKYFMKEKYIYPSLVEEINAYINKK